MSPGHSAPLVWLMLNLISEAERASIITHWADAFSRKGVSLQELEWYLDNFGTPPLLGFDLIRTFTQGYRKQSLHTLY